MQIELITPYFRIGYGMELDPKYVDVTVKRWEDYTKNKALLIQ